jgi:hypothetical protein
MMPESTLQPSVPETIGARFDVVALVTSGRWVRSTERHPARSAARPAGSSVSRATPQRAGEQSGRNPAPADNTSRDVD